jgi:hypothetical protein
MKSLSTRFIPLAAMVLFGASPSLASNILLRGTLGPTFPTGEVGDRLLGPGIDLGGGIYAGLDERIFVGLGGHLSLYTGQSATNNFVTEDYTNGGGGISFEVGLLVYVLKEEDTPLRIFLGGHAGLGAIGWDYSSERQAVVNVDSDGVGYGLLAPEAGIEVALGESAGLFASGRFEATFYGDKTSEDFLFDLDGGNFFVLQGGASFFF